MRQPSQCMHLQIAEHKALRLKFLDQYTHLRPRPCAKIIRRRQAPSPDHLAAAFKHGPSRPVTDGNAICEKHLLQLTGLPATVGPVGVTWPPIPQD